MESVSNLFSVTQLGSREVKCSANRSLQNGGSSSFCLIVSTTDGRTTEGCVVDFVSWKENIAKISIQDTYIKCVGQVENSVYNMLSFMLKREGIMGLFWKTQTTGNSSSFLKGELGTKESGKLLFTLWCPLNRAFTTPMKWVSVPVLEKPR